MNQLAARILQEEFALERKNSGKDIDEQHGRTDQDDHPVLVKEDGSVRNQESQLAHEPETEG